jgi:hypothetical protein
MTTCVRRLVAVSAVILVCWDSSPSAQAPALDDVLTRVASYLHVYVPRLARIVASEEYEQRVSVSGGSTPIVVSNGNMVSGGGPGNATDVWKLKSEVLLVRYPLGDVDWMWFRDVSEAGGKRLPHDPDRLVKLFVTPNADTAEQASRISYESFRYNLGGATVPATNPVLVVALMQAGYQPRLRFKLGDTEKSLGPNVRELKFEEREETEPAPGQKKGQRLPLLLDPAGRIRGTAWVDVKTGEILKTDARIGELRTQTTTTTTFTQDERFLLLVPKEMRTRWTYVRGGPVTGVAKYSNFRQFDVSADTPQLQLPQAPQ